MSFIPKGDLYRLIAHSKLPSAEKFEFWVFDEVLPTIRKTGGYVSNEDMFINTYLPFADAVETSHITITLLIYHCSYFDLQIKAPFTLTDKKCLAIKMSTNVNLYISTITLYSL